MGWSHIATLADGWLFFYRSADGAMTTAPVEGDGRTGYGDATVTPEAGWTHVVGDGGELVWFYRRDTGAARSIRFVDGWRAADHTHAGRVPAGHDRVVGLAGNRVLHYSSASGRSTIVTLTETGAIARTSEVVLPRDWTALGATGRGHLLGVDAGGRGAVVRLDADGAAVTHQLDLGAPGWTAAAGFDRGVVLWTLAGSAVIAEIDPTGRVERLTPWSVPPAANLAAVSAP
jgi:hypothetical protein